MSRLSNNQIINLYDSLCIRVKVTRGEDKALCKEALKILERDYSGVIKKYHDFKVLVPNEVIPVLEEVPPILEEVPSVSEEVPSVSEEVPSVSEEVPSVSEEVPSVPNGVSSVSEEVPSVSEEIPLIIEEVPLAICSPKVVKKVHFIINDVCKEFIIDENQENGDLPSHDSIKKQIEKNMKWRVKIRKDLISDLKKSRRYRGSKNEKRSLVNNKFISLMFEDDGNEV